MTIATKTEFATMQGVSLSAISKWLDRGHIHGPALTGDGRINVEIAEIQLGESLDHSRSLGRRAGEQSDQFAEAAAPVEVSPDAGASTLARMQILRLEALEREAQREREKDLERRGVYCRSEDLRREQNRAIGQLVAAVDNWLPDLVAEIGGDREMLALARAAWRKFRERQAGAAADRAAALPEYLSDAA